MSGVFDPGGIAAMTVVAAGGLLVGAWAISRRDLQG
jgi:hypothetical protein